MNDDGFLATLDVAERPAIREWGQMPPTEFQMRVGKLLQDTGKSLQDNTRLLAEATMQTTANTRAITNLDRKVDGMKRPFAAELGARVGYILGGMVMAVVAQVSGLPSSK